MDAAIACPNKKPRGESPCGSELSAITPSSKPDASLEKASHRDRLVVEDLEDLTEICDFEYLLEPLIDSEKLKSAFALGHFYTPMYQRANPGSVNVLDAAQVDQNLRLPVVQQVKNGSAKYGFSFSMDDTSCAINNGEVIRYDPTRHFQWHGFLAGSQSITKLFERQQKKSFGFIPA